MSLQLSQLAHCYHCMVSHQMISRISHSKFLKFICFSQWPMTNAFKQTHRKLTAISHFESSGQLSVSMVLAHTFTGLFTSHIRKWCLVRMAWFVMIRRCQSVKYCRPCRQWAQLSFVVLQHCLGSFHRQTRSQSHQTRGLIALGYSFACKWGVKGYFNLNGYEDSLALR